MTCWWKHLIYRLAVWYPRSGKLLAQDPHPLDGGPKSLRNFPERYLDATTEINQTVELIDIDRFHSAAWQSETIEELGWRAPLQRFVDDALRCKEFT